MSVFVIQALQCQYTTLTIIYYYYYYHYYIRAYVCDDNITTHNAPRDLELLFSPRPAGPHNNNNYNTSAAAPLPGPLVSLAHNPKRPIIPISFPFHPRWRERAVTYTHIHEYGACACVRRRRLRRRNPLKSHPQPSRRTVHIYYNIIYVYDRLVLHLLRLSPFDSNAPWWGGGI